jgi:hypothetical protein
VHGERRRHRRTIAPRAPAIFFRVGCNFSRRRRVFPATSKFITASLLTMKLIPNLTRAAAIISVAAFALAVFSTQFNDVLYGLAACAFIVVIAARDYAPKGRRREPCVTHASPPTPRRAHRFRLAA